MTFRGKRNELKPNWNCFMQYEIVSENYFVLCEFRPVPEFVIRCGIYDDKQSPPN